MKNVILLFFIPLCLISCVHTAQESAAPTPLQEKTQAHAQKIIDACWAISEEDRNSGVTARMRQGTYNTIECLFNSIKRISGKMLKRKETKTEFVRALEQFTESAYHLYYDIFNAHKECAPCGTVYHVVYLGHVSGLLEDILQTMLEQAYEYDIPVQED